MGRTFAANVLEETEKGFFSKAQAQATIADRLDSKTLLRYFLALAHLITSWLRAYCTYVFVVQATVLLKYTTACLRIVV